MFVGRVRELDFLEGLFSSGKPKLVLVYGRRRVGKTSLIKEFAKRKSGLYFLARQESSQDQLKSFSVTLSEFFGDGALAFSPLQNYDAFFTYLRERLKPGTPVFFDEFPYMVEANPSLPSVLQDYWDNHFQKIKSFFVLCGSSVRMMEKLAGYKSPIYGRRTEQLLLGPLPFFDALELMEKTPLEKAVEYYAVLGGTPAYLQLMDFGKSVEENVIGNVLPKTAFLNQDAIFILREELDEPRNYFSILKSLAKGKTMLAEIVNDTGLERGLVAKYLAVLQDLHIVERKVPVTEKREVRSRKGLYVVSDPYFRFWFAFVFENAGYAEFAGPQKTFADKIAPEFNAYIGRVFEDIAVSFLRQKTPFSKDYVFGRWWGDGEEIDIVGVNEEKMLLFEVKWSALDEKEARRVLGLLAGKAELVLREKPAAKTRFGLVAKKVAGKQRLRDDGFLVYDLADF
ncbi:ATP-binding protein [Candidatus Micrarchaeota archaeon]|nr:ATP-binding protein [Candidatus Micrarchaeota archaeon]